MARSEQGVTHAVITPGSTLLNPIPRGIYVNVAGTATIEDAAGTSIVYNLEVGLLPFRPHKITAATATLIRWD